MDVRTISKIENLEFKISFTETNIRYLLGAKKINRVLIESHKQEIRKAKLQLKAILESQKP